MAPNLFPLVSVPIYALLETWAYTRLNISVDNSSSASIPLLKSFMLFFVLNGSLYMVFWGLIYNYFITPLRRFPTTTVSSHMH